MKKSKSSAIVIFILSLSLVCSLIYILLTNTVLKDEIFNSSESSKAATWNTDERLPIGSIFTTDDGIWMVIGQKPVTYLDDDYQLVEDESWTFDYYCVPYPEGCRSVYAEFENTALYNKSDIKEVFFVGKSDSTENEYRNWIDNYDTTKYNPQSSSTHKSGAIYTKSPCQVEQKLRQEGKLTSDIWGNDYTGGIIGSDLLDGDVLYINYEWINVALAQHDANTGQSGSK